MANGFVYILKCADGNFYVGSTNNLSRRLKEHQAGKSRATKNRLPVKLVYQKQFDSLKEARRFETFIKAQRNKKFYQKLIKGRFRF